MAEIKLSDAIRSASAVNLKYSAELLNLGREYVRAFTAALTAGQDVREPETRAPDQSRPPLLLAGKAGEIANAAFAINNPRSLKGTVTLDVTGDFADTTVTVEPESLRLEDAGGEIIVRILAKIGRNAVPGTDYTGTLLIREMNHPVTGFVVRKLPG